MAKCQLWKTFGHCVSAKNYVFGCVGRAVGTV